jgi:hypothetical protein
MQIVIDPIVTFARASDAQAGEVILLCNAKTGNFRLAGTLPPEEKSHG